MTHLSDDPAATLHLVSERVELFMPRLSDTRRMLDYSRRNREHLAPWEPSRPPEYFTEAHWRRQIRAARQEADRDDGLRTVIVLRDDPHGEIIGVANLSQIVRGAFQSAVLGYSIDAAYERRGLMREALQRLLEHAFGPLDLHRVQAGYRPENERSGRVLEALGFEREGFARDYLFIDGAWRDHVLMAKRRPYTLPGG